MKDFIYLLQVTDNNGFTSIVNVYTNFYKLKQDLLHHADDINGVMSLDILLYPADQYTPNAVYSLNVVEHNLNDQQEYKQNPLKRLNQVAKERTKLISELNQ